MLLNRAIRFCCGVFLRITLLLSVKGSRNIPKCGGVIIASNHASFLDPVILSVASSRVLYFMAKEDLFKLGIFSKLISMTGAFPVKRNSFSKSTMQKALKVLKSGGALVVFPEGTRSKDGQIGRGQAGVAWLAHSAQVPIVPVRIYGTDKVWGAGSNIIKPYPIKVSFGRPLSISCFESNDHEKATVLLMSKIREL